MDEARRLIRPLAALLAVLAGGGPAACAAPAAWPADGAVRFTVDIRSPPSDPCAGILAVLPNGGILPPNGGCLVQDEAGAELKQILSGSAPATLRETPHPIRTTSTIIMTLSRTALITIIIVLALAVVGSLAALMHERNQPGGVEIRLDKNGLKIQEN